MTLSELITESARAGIRLQNPKTGAMPAGHNGPYNDPETPVRNTSHWTIQFLKAYEISQDSHFSEAAFKALDYLCSPEARPEGFAFYHRTNPEKDNSNGLIGQAWTIEALVYAAQFIDDNRLIPLAEEVFLMHPFDESHGLWDRLSVDGTSPGIDETLNHQLWFGAVGLFLGQHSSPVKERAHIFLDRLSGILNIYNSGLIVHHLKLDKNWKEFARMFKRILFNRKSVQTDINKSIGYQLFNLYAFAMIYEILPGHQVFRSPEFKQALSYIQTPGFKAAIDINPFGYPYNPPGFEMAYVLKTFQTGDINEQNFWINRQIDRCYDRSSRLMERQTDDSHTQAARLYEAVRLIPTGTKTSLLPLST